MTKLSKPVRGAVTAPPLGGGTLVKTRRGSGVRDGLRFWILRLYTYKDGRPPTVHLQTANGFLNIEPLDEATDGAIDRYLLSWHDELVWSFVEEGILPTHAITWDLSTEVQLFCAERPLAATAKKAALLLLFDEVPSTRIQNLGDWLEAEDISSFARWMQQRLIQDILP